MYGTRMVRWLASLNFTFGQSKLPQNIWRCAYINIIIIGRAPRLMRSQRRKGTSARITVIPGDHDNITTSVPLNRFISSVISRCYLLSVLTKRRYQYPLLAVISACLPAPNRFLCSSAHHRQFVTQCLVTECYPDIGHVALSDVVSGCSFTIVVLA